MTAPEPPAGAAGGPLGGTGPAAPHPPATGTTAPPPGTTTPPPGTTAPAPGGRKAPSSGTTAPARRAGRTAGRTLALALLIFVTVVLVLFVVFNSQSVPISLVFGDVRAPLVLALVIAAALGGLLVGLAGLVLRARRSRRG